MLICILYLPNDGYFNYIYFLIDKRNNSYLYIIFGYTMKNACIITGDIIGFTTIPPARRKQLAEASMELLVRWTGNPAYASFFRGDSFQVLFQDVGTAIRRAIQLRCWFKKQSENSDRMLDARMVIGLGEVAYYGKTILDSDGEAFHLSGRAFDKLDETENLLIETRDEHINSQFKVLFALAEVIMANWTITQAEAIYLLLEGKTQQQIANELHIGQSAVNNRIKLSHWKQIEKMNIYIESLIGQE